LIVRAPSPPLRPFIELVWASAGAAPAPFAQSAFEHVLPTGSMHLVVRLGEEPLRIYESSDDRVGQLLGDSIVGGARLRFCVREMSAPSFSVGAALRPGAADLLFSAGADELAGHHTPLQDLWGAAARSLREHLLETASAEERLAVFEAALASRLPQVRLMHPAVAAALDEMHKVASVESMVKRSGVSHRRFIALFRRSVGLTPKSYLRMARFQRALQCFKQGKAVSLAQIAAQTGYSDQSHFNRDFLEFSGVTPATYDLLAPKEMNHLPIDARSRSKLLNTGVRMPTSEVPR
jgi:AraC-like DNA-binding protein